MSKWKAFDLIGTKIIKLFTEMAGIATMLAALVATIWLGFNKNPKHPFLFVLSLAPIYMSIIVVRGHLNGIKNIISITNSIHNSKTFTILNFTSGVIVSLIPLMMIIVLANSLI